MNNPVNNADPSGLDCIGVECLAQLGMSDYSFGHTFVGGPLYDRFGPLPNQFTDEDMKRLLDEAEDRLKRAEEAQRKAEEDRRWEQALAQLEWYANHKDAIEAGMVNAQLDALNIGAQINSMPIYSTGTAPILEEGEELEEMAQGMIGGRISSAPRSMGVGQAIDIAEEEPLRASWWTSGTARGAFTLKMNNYGGKLYTTRGIIKSDDFAAFVDEALSRGERVNVLTGVHGNANGRMIGALRFKIWDVARFNRLGVTIWNMDTMTTSEITDVLNSTDRTIGAFCYSGSCLAPYMTP